MSGVFHVHAGVPIVTPMEPRHIPAEPALLTIGEAAKALGVHVDTLRRWADAGLIQVVVLPSGHRRFRAADIAAQLGAAS